MRPLTAHLLGTFRVTVDGNLVDTVSSRLTRHLIAYLLAHRQAPVPRDVLMDAFWPGVAPASARNRLHVALSRARGVFRAACREPVIERRFDAYRIAGSFDVWIDVEQFEQTCAAGQAADRAGDTAAAAHHYEAACQLYEDDFLAEDPYAEWTLEHKDRLRLLAVEILSRLVEIYAGRHDYGLACLLARRILAMDPCNEQVALRLMKSYAGSGQRHLALRQYHQMTETLWENLGVRPSAETAALYEQLRRHRG